MRFAAAFQTDGRPVTLLKAFFLKQARRTGTLWETERQKNSNCHGFAGVAADLILRCAVR